MKDCVPCKGSGSIFGLICPACQGTCVQKPDPNLFPAKKDKK